MVIIADFYQKVSLDLVLYLIAFICIDLVNQIDLVVIDTSKIRFDRLKDLLSNH